MLRKLVLVGIVAGSSAAVPILYEANPDAVRGLLRGVANVEPESEPVMAATLRAGVDDSSNGMAGRKVRLPADTRGHFNADFRLNGKAVDAMVDTGATLVAINRTTARRIGLDLRTSDFTHRVTTANGEARAAAAMIERIGIGRIEVRNVQAVVLEDEALSGTLVGMAFLSRLRRYQVEAGELTLEQ
jgi:aspartyl protease family protein